MFGSSISRKQLLSLGLGLSVLGSTPAAMAQSGTGFGDSSQRTANAGGTDIVDPVATYVFGPQDKIKVSVGDHPEYDQDNVIVPPDGLIVMPVFGALQVNGKTRAQVQADLTRIIGKRLRNPHVTVSIVSLRPASSGYVFVIGDVQAPGTVDIRNGYRISNLLARVGGVRNGRIDDTEATLARSKGKQKVQIPIDLFKASISPKSAADAVLQSGDILTVRVKDPAQVAINGDIRGPGFYNMRRVPHASDQEIPMNAHLVDLLVAAGLTGGVTPNAAGGGAAGAAAGGAGGAVKAGPTNATTGEVQYTGFVMRKQQKIPLHINDAIKFKDSTANIALQAGDFVTVEKVPPITVYINGFVGSPNAYTFTRGVGVVQAIAQAGSLTKPTEKINATIHRKAGNMIIPVDLNRAYLGQAPEDNPVLEDQDTLQLDEPNIIRVYVSGAVNKPTGQDALRLPTNATVLDAIVQSGGLASHPDLVTLSILRTLPNGKTTILHVDPVTLLNGTDPSQNGRLQNGDVITAADLQKRTVYVSGQVGRTGALELKPGEGLVQAIADAGGTNDTAALTRVTVNRGGEVHTIDTYNALRMGAKLDFPLEAGDNIIVPLNEQRVLVIAGVNKPGFVPMPEKKTLTVLDAINLAGGPQYGAKIQEVLVIRQTPTGNKNITIPYDKIQKGDLSANIPLEDHDVVAVPQGKASGNFIQKSASYIGLLGFFRSFAGF